MRSGSITNMLFETTGAESEGPDGSPPSSVAQVTGTV